MYMYVRVHVQREQQTEGEGASAMYSPPRSMRLCIKILRPHHEADMVHLLSFQDCFKWLKRLAC